MVEKALPLLRVHPSQIAERALVVGDPNRAASCAALLDDAEELGFFREYRTFTGTYKGTPVTVCSHGVGSAGAAIPFHELFLGGVRTIIRAGTCGALQKGIPDGSMVIGTGAVRIDGSTPGLIPMEYPAVSHYQVVNALLAACQKAGIENPCHGIEFCLGKTETEESDYRRVSTHDSAMTDKAAPGCLSAVRYVCRNSSSGRLSWYRWVGEPGRNYWC